MVSKTSVFGHIYKEMQVRRTLSLIGFNTASENWSYESNNNLQVNCIAG